MYCSPKAYPSEFSTHDIHWLYIARIPTVALLFVAERIEFIAPHNAGPEDSDMARYGRADTVTRIATWFPIFSLVSNMPFTLRKRQTPSSHALQAVDYTCHFCEVAAILAREFPSPLSDRILSTLFSNPSAVDHLQLSPPYLLGVVLVIIGAAMRQACYDTLGRFFTFQLSVFKEHKLVTSGPYSIVLHPSYMALLIARAGLFVMQIFPGSYVFESGLLNIWWTAITIGIWEAWIVSIVFEIVVLRIPKEDAVLRKEFGAEWEVWAKKTPYRLVPYVC